MANSFTGQIEDARTLAAFKQILASVSGRGLREVQASLGRYGQASTQLRFRTQSAPDGSRWQPSRRALAEGGDTLRDTSRLRNSITWVADAQSVSWGTNVVYARIHQEGFDGVQQVGAHTRRVTFAFGKRLKAPTSASVGAHARRMRMPARQFLGISDADRIELLQILSEHLDRSAGGAAR